MKERIIYYLEKPISLSDEKEKEGFISLTYTSKKTLTEALRLLKKTPANGVHIYSNGEPNLWKRFKVNFKMIVAAGGIVVNEKNQKLFIKRLAHWDLPKGKLEKGETLSLAAKREVEEETGISINKIIGKIINTFHIYETRVGTPILKKVVWYEMFSKDKKKPIPQIEENIEEVKWFSDEEIKILMNKSYKSICQLLDFYYSKEHSKTLSK